MNRRKLVLVNSVVVMMTTIVNIVFGMVEVSLFISVYGSEINGLKQTGGQLLSYLALIEAGISASFLYSMYKPIAQNDNNALSAIYSGFRKSINKVVMKMMIAASIVSLIYPLFLKKEGLPYWFMVSVFGLLSAKAIVPYFFTYVPKYMIIAKEQKYKAELINCITNAIVYITEIVLLKITQIPIQILLLVCVVLSICSGIVYNIVMRKIYGNILNNHAEPDYSPKSMSKSVLAHNISGLIFNSTDNIVISVLSSLEMVTIYSSYNLLVSQVSTVFQSIYDGTTASLGIKIANKDDNSYAVYRELFSTTLFIAVIISSVFIVMINSFIKLWIGEVYCVEIYNVFFFSIILFTGILSPCIYSVRNACGLYKESKNFTIFQAALNLGITLLLTPSLGITGALVGTVIARIFITIPCNYNLVNRKIFPEHKSKWIELPISIGLIIIFSYIAKLSIALISIERIIHNTYFEFLFNTVISTAIIVILSYCYYYGRDRDFKRFVKNLFYSFKKHM